MNGASVLSGDSDERRLLATGQRVAEQLALDCVLAEVVRELASRGIESLLLKGPALARWLYEDQSERPYGDIDLLVAPTQFDQAERCLAELGFNRSETDRHPHERTEHHENWVSPGRYRALLELHHTLFLLTVPPELVWRHLSADSETIEIAGMDVNIPGAAGRALIVALHAAQHGRRVALPIRDLEQALTRVSPSVWSQATALARELGCLPAFSAGLQLTPEGRELGRRLGVETEASSRSLRLRAASAPDTSIGIDTLVTTTGLLPRLRLIWQELVPSTSFMRATYDLADRGRTGLIAAYLMRPVLVALKLPRGLIAWLAAAIPARAGSRRRP